ncbi:macrodontain-1-like [Mercurialis annua]|uniref:macrodontain-1-like n=1 Tax=Mercurialis annua TaxID=3986 RepID=UPI00215E8AF7|nr:macrodontain-1-like [Mercurialis annua]
MALSNQTKYIYLILSIFVFQVRSRILTIEDATIVEKHEQWMVHHGRTYQNIEEKEKRLQIFKTNLKNIQNFNKASNKTYELGLNHFADLTNEEFLATYNGYKMQKLDQATNISTKTPHDYQIFEVPDSVDWRQRGFVTYVKSQGKCGSCWAFSAVAAVEGLVGYDISLSEQQVLDCAQSNGCRSGTMDGAFRYIIENQGITLESYYPYELMQKTCRMSRNVVKISAYMDVAPNDEETLKAFVSMQPVSVAVDSGSYNFQFYRGGILMAQDCGHSLNHGVLLVGYGTSVDGIKYWLIKNSWGVQWGENGYMRLERGANVYGGACGVALNPSFPIR